MNRRGFRGDAGASPGGASTPEGCRRSRRSSSRLKSFAGSWCCGCGGACVRRCLPRRHLRRRPAMSRRCHRRRRRPSNRRRCCCPERHPEVYADHDHGRRGGDGASRLRSHLHRHHPEPIRTEPRSCRRDRSLQTEPDSAHDPRVHRRVLRPCASENGSPLASPRQARPGRCLRPVRRWGVPQVPRRAARRGPACRRLVPAPGRSRRWEMLRGCPRSKRVPHR